MEIFVVKAIRSSRHSCIELEMITETSLQKLLIVIVLLLLVGKVLLQLFGRLASPEIRTEM